MNFYNPRIQIILQGIFAEKLDDLQPRIILLSKEIQEDTRKMFLGTDYTTGGMKEAWVAHHRAMDTIRSRFFRSGRINQLYEFELYRYSSIANLPTDECTDDALECIEDSTPGVLENFRDKWGLDVLEEQAPYFYGLRALFDMIPSDFEDKFRELIKLEKEQQKILKVFPKIPSYVNRPVRV